MGINRNLLTGALAKAIAIGALAVFVTACGGGAAVSENSPSGDSVTSTPSSASTSEAPVTTTTPPTAPETPTIPTTNTAPTISGRPATSATIGQQYTFTPTAQDQNGDALIFSVTNLPSWASFGSSNGRLSGIPPSADAGTTYSNIVVSVSDGNASASLTAFAIQVAGGAGSTSNHAPTIAGSPAASVQTGQTYVFKPTAVDADGDALGFSISNKPAWATFSSATGQLSGTPSTAQAGTYSNILISVSDGKAQTSLGTFAIVVAPTSNKAPVISGTPSASVAPSAAYNFQPTASDADGDALTFSIQNAPSWANFNTSTGKLSGTPTVANVATYSGIAIKVSDGKTTASLPVFSIAVVQTANGTATLSWVAPTENSDGSALTNLAGYRVYYGTSASALNTMAELSNPSLTTYMVTGLTAGTYYFALKAYTSANVESDLSNIASKLIQQ